MGAWFGASGAGATRRQAVVVNVTPGQVSEAVFREVAALRPEGGTGAVDLGLGAIFSYLHASPAAVRGRLEVFLELSARWDLPVVVQLDGEQWWGARPDLWNWWDPARPGFDPANRANVEWTDWGPGHAIRIAWRNWGRQIRVLPPPNLMSPRYRDACHREMRALVPVILDWWRGLPEARRDLLIGIKLGWESAIGVNAFYYPGGNALWGQPEAEDPRTGLDTTRIPDRGVTALGYAAVSSAGLARGGPLREADLTEVVRRHLADLCALAATLGVPRDRLFTHGGGWAEGERLTDAALNPYACPGWSFYRHAADPSRDPGVRRALARSDAPYWAAVEWLLTGPRDTAAWTEALRRTLADPRCRYLCIYNWGGIRDNPAAREALRTVTGGP